MPLTMPSYPVQRHKLPDKASRTAWGVAGTSSCTMASARMTNPGVQKPHCKPWCSLKHCCITCSAWSWGATPSIVTTDRSAHCNAKRLHDLMAWPSTNTVQAPHCAVSQPWCVPVNWHCSRNTSINSDDGATSSVMARWLSCRVRRAECTVLLEL